MTEDSRESIVRRCETVHVSELVGRIKIKDPSDDMELREYVAKNEAEAAEKKAELAFENCGLGARFQGSRLSNYEPTSEEQREALRQVRAYCAGDAIKYGKGLLLGGAPDGGKTHLLAGVLWEAAQKGKTIKYLSLKRLFLEFRSIMDGKGQTEKQLLDELIAVQVLVLDDFTKYKNDAGAYQYDTLWMLLDERYANIKATLSTTNLEQREVGALFDERTWRRMVAGYIRVPRTERGAE